MTVIRSPCSSPGLITTRCPLEPSTPAPSAATTPAPSAPRMRGFGTDGRPLPHPEVQAVERGGPQRDQHLAGGRAPDRERPRSGGPPGRRPRGSERPSSGAIVGSNPGTRVTAAELRRLAEELGLDVVGAAPAEPYEETERHIRRAPRARPVRGHALHDGAARRSRATRRRLLAGARTVVSAALCYYAPAAEPGAGGGPSAALHLADGYARAAREARRARAPARRHVPRARGREPARRPRGGGARGVGFYGKNTLLITRRHGSWVVLGTLVTDAEIEPTPPLDSTAARARSASTPARPARSTSPGTLDATQCLSYWTQAPATDPGASTASALGDRSTAATSARTSARGTAASRSGAPATRCRAGAEPNVSLVEWLEARRRRAARAATSACTCRATTAATCSATRSSRSATPGGPSTSARRAARRQRRRPLLREHAAWALARLDGADGA